MDYQNRVGSKKGAGGLAGDSETNQYRQERVKSLLLSNTSISSDPYVFKNNLGILECKLCLTTHMNETSYLTHRNGRRHVINLMRRSEFEEKKKLKQSNANDINDTGLGGVQKRKWHTIGKPDYKIHKIKHPTTNNKGLRIEINLKDLKADTLPMYRLMSCFEQKKEEPNPNYQYLIVSCEPYQNICFKIPGDTIDLSSIDMKMWDFFNQDDKMYYIQFFYLDL